MTRPDLNATTKAILHGFGELAAVAFVVFFLILLTSCAPCDPVYLGCTR